MLARHRRVAILSPLSWDLDQGPGSDGDETLQWAQKGRGKPRFKFPASNHPCTKSAKTHKICLRPHQVRHVEHNDSKYQIPVPWVWNWRHHPGPAGRLHRSRRPAQSEETRTREARLPSRPGEYLIQSKPYVLLWRLWFLMLPSRGPFWWAKCASWVDDGGLSAASARSAFLFPLCLPMDRVLVAGIPDNHNLLLTDQRHHILAILCVTAGKARPVTRSLSSNWISIWRWTKPQ